MSILPEQKQINNSKKTPGARFLFRSVGPLKKRSLPKSTKIRKEALKIKTYAKKLHENLTK